MIQKIALVFALLFVVGLTQNPLNITTNVTGYFNSQLGTQLNFEVWTGYVPITGVANTALFYELVTQQGYSLSTLPKNTPLVFWFQGGPGCSSQFGSWSEIGPFTVSNNSGTLQIGLRPQSWNLNATIVFVDQPFNVGFSYSASISVDNTHTAAKYFTNWLTGFFKRYPNLKQNPTWFFGESFAGHYIPAFATAVIRDKLGVNLIGVGIGDGWTDPYQQLQAYSDYYYSASLASQATQENLQKQELKAREYLDAGFYGKASNLFDNMTNNTAFYGNIDIYNYEIYGTGGPSGAYSALLMNRTFDNIYGIPSFVNYQDCNDTIYNIFLDDIAKSYKVDVEFLLTQVNVLLYNGQLDIIVNTAGAQNWINTILWAGMSHWKENSKVIWRLPGSLAPVGTIKSYGNFCFAEVYGAGHMVPFDQPNSALDLFQRALEWYWGY